MKEIQKRKIKRVSLGATQAMLEQIDARLNEKQKNKEFKDVGTRVGGSKKEKAAYKIIMLADLNEIEKDAITAEQLVVKEKVYSPVDVSDERQRGVSAGAAYLKVKIRASCAAKPPNSPERRQSYVKFISVLVKDLQDCYMVEDVRKLMGKYRNFSQAEIIMAFFEISQESADELSKKMQSYITFHGLTTLIYGKAFSNMLYVSSDAAKTVWNDAYKFDPITEDMSKKYVEKYISDLDYRIEQNKKRIDEYKQKTQQEIKYEHKDRVQFFNGDVEVTRQYFIGRLENSINAYENQKNEIPDKIKPRSNDWSWADLPTERKQAVKSNEREINSGISLDFIKRTGGIKIDDSLVDMAKLNDENDNPIISKFGFQSIQFGHYVKDNEAKRHIKHFLGAVLDLAEILDIDIKQLNQIGQLSIAFGARGKGKALAHYEPGRKIINLTKGNGDGTLCHEWGHYFDNILLMIGSDRITTSFASQTFATNSNSNITIANYDVRIAFGELLNFIKNGKVGITEPVKIRFYAFERKTPFKFRIGTKNFATELHGTPKETFEYWAAQHTFFANEAPDNNYLKYQTEFFGKLISDLELPFYDIELKPKGSQYFSNSAKLKSKYWIDNVELFARAWESYILDKLKAAGRYNNYLVSGQYEEAITIADGSDVVVYPIGRERVYMFELFEKLIDAMKKAYNLKPFKAFSNIREDEYIDLKDTYKNDKSNDLRKEISKNDLKDEKKIKFAQVKYKLAKARLNLLSI